MTNFMYKRHLVPLLSLCIAALLLGLIFHAARAIQPVPASLPAEKTALPRMTVIDPPSGEVRILASDEQGVVFELAAPDFRFQRRADSGRPCDILHAAGYGEMSESGWPGVPGKSVMLGIPSGTIPEVTLLGSEIVSVGKVDLCPVPSLVFSYTLEEGASFSFPLEKNLSKTPRPMR